MTCLVVGHDMAAWGGATALLKIAPKSVLNYRLKLPTVSFGDVANLRKQCRFHLSSEFLAMGIQLSYPCLMIILS